MPNKNNNTRNSNTNASVKTNNSTRRRRRGALKPNNAKRIQGHFQKPPRHPGPPVRKVAQRPRVVYMNDIDIGNLSASEINAMLERMG
jgi:hypothetical protein